MAWVDLLVFVAGIVLDYYFGLWSRVLSAFSWLKSFFTTAKADVSAAVTKVEAVNTAVKAAVTPAATTTTTTSK